MGGRAMSEKQYDWIMRGVLQEVIELIETDQKPIIVPAHHNTEHPANSKIHKFPELFIQITGVTEFSLPGQTYALKPHEVMIVPPGMAHCEKTIGDSDEFMHMVIIFYEDEIELHIGQSNADSQPEVCYAEKFKPIHGKLMSKTIDEYVSHERSQVRHNRILSKGLQLTLLGCLLENIRYGNA